MIQSSVARVNHESNDNTNITSNGSPALMCASFKKPSSKRLRKHAHQHHHQQQQQTNNAGLDLAAGTRDEDLLDVPIGKDANGFSHSPTLQGYHKRHSYNSNNNSPQLGYQSEYSSNSRRISSRPSDVVLGAMSQKAINGRFFSGSEVLSSGSNTSNGPDSSMSSGSCNTSTCSGDSSRSNSSHNSLNSEVFNTSTEFKSNGLMNASVPSLSSDCSDCSLRIHPIDNRISQASGLSVSSSGSDLDTSMSPPATSISKFNSCHSPDVTMSPTSHRSVETLKISGKLQARAKALKKSQKKSLTESQKNRIYDEDSGDDITDSTLIFDVPMATSSTAKLFKNSNAAQSTTILRKAWGNAEKNGLLHPQPLPGQTLDPASCASTPALNGQWRKSVPSSISSLDSTECSTPKNNRISVFSDLGNVNSSTSELSRAPFYHSLSPMAKQLSNFYEYSVRAHANEVMAQRASVMDNKLCGEEVELAAKKLDDLRLTSPEKLGMLTPTRPMWLPPKDKTEAIRQEHEFKKLIEHEGHRMRKESEMKSKRKRERTIADARLKYLADKDCFSNTNVNEVKKLMWVSKADPATRVAIFAKVIKNTYEIASDEQLNKLPPANITSNASLDVNAMVDSTLGSCDDPRLLTTLTNLLKRVTRMDNWTFKSCKTVLSLIQQGYSAVQVMRTLHYLNDFVMDKKFASKFTDNILKNHVMINYAKAFRDDLIVMNPTNFIRLLNVLNPSVIFKLISLLIVISDYKLLYAFVLTILLHYHFGWNNLQLLLNCNFKEEPIKITDEELFWNRVYKYYKKF